MADENNEMNPAEESPQDAAPEGQSQSDDVQEDTSGEEITPEEAEMLAMLEGNSEGDSDGTAGKSEDELNADEAASLAAAMAAINQVQGVADSVAPPAPAAPEPETQAFASPEFGADLSPKAKEGMDLLSDVHLDVRIELGRTQMYVEDVLKLGDGAVVELDKLAGDPVDVFVNNRKVARGEVLVLNDMFCVRISEIVDITETVA